LLCLLLRAPFLTSAAHRCRSAYKPRPKGTQAALLDQSHGIRNPDALQYHLAPVAHCCPTHGRHPVPPEATPLPVAAAAQKGSQPLKRQARPRPRLRSTSKRRNHHPWVCLHALRLKAAPRPQEGQPSRHLGVSTSPCKPPVCRPATGSAELCQVVTN
jgi:hypothetical protein